MSATDGAAVPTANSSGAEAIQGQSSSPASVVPVPSITSQPANAAPPVLSSTSIATTSPASSSANAAQSSTIIPTASASQINGAQINTPSNSAFNFAPECSPILDRQCPENCGPLTQVRSPNGNEILWCQSNRPISSSSGLSPGAKAGIAVGVIAIVGLLAGAAFFILRRKRARGSHRRRTTSNIPISVLPRDNPAAAAASPATSGSNDAKYTPVVTSTTPVAVAALFKQPPKDDSTMLRLFRAIDSRITDHVLNYYIGGDSIRAGELETCSPDTRREMEGHVSKLDELLLDESSRIHALRAVMAGMVMRSIDEGVFYAREGRRRGSLMAELDGIDADPYSESRANAVFRLVESTWDNFRCFAVSVAPADDTARHRSIDEIVRSVAEFATEVEQHEKSNWVLLWNTEFDAAVMDVVADVKRDGQGEVRGVVFPGLRKEVGVADVGGHEKRRYGSEVLAKVQVLVG